MTVFAPTLFDLPAEVQSPTLRDAPTARLLLPPNTPRDVWADARRQGIGGADVAALLGLGEGKYTSPRHVYEEKHGRPTFKDNESAEIGREIEPFIGRMFSKRSRVKIAGTPGTLVHVDRPWMRVNVDFLTRERPGPASGLLECKSRSEYQADQWERGAVPDAPAIQCHWGMAVGGWDHGYVAALVGGNKLRWVRLERDEEMIEQLVDHCGTWFEKHVVEGAPPPADGYEATTKLLAKLWSVKPADVVQVDLPKAKELRARRADIKERKKALEHELRAVENEMRLLTGASEIAMAGGKQAWTNKQNGNFCDDEFAEAEPEMAAEYTHLVPARDLERLKTEQPAIYAKYRGRRLVVSSKEI
ncbi:YqaJ viral recombinase family protein [Streptomyces sp. NPDC001552]|uniref:YqaJ viral recombinase family nuclease n=1 Tax=Streptomyces sp. NPDC001552 TaxID=3364587 RepID=UPI00369BE4DE